MSEQAKRFMELNGLGYWDEHPGHPAEDWKLEVANGDTRTGYWDWAEHRDCEE